MLFSAVKLDGVETRPYLSNEEVHPSQKRVHRLVWILALEVADRFRRYEDAWRRFSRFLPDDQVELFRSLDPHAVALLEPIEAGPNDLLDVVEGYTHQLMQLCDRFRDLGSAWEGYVRGNKKLLEESGILVSREESLKAACMAESFIDDIPFKPLNGLQRNISHADRPISELMAWWRRPFIEDIGGGHFDVCCLDGSHPTEVGLVGSASSIEEAVKIAKSYEPYTMGRRLGTSDADDLPASA